jgi:glycerol-3-phosphate acyltransferase PlsX
VFLGLNGVVIKSHGGTDEVGYKSALGLAYDMARNRLMDKVGDTLQRFPINKTETSLPTESEA